jgi:integrase
MPPHKLWRRRAKGSGSITFDKSRNKYIARMPDTGIGTPPKKQFGTEDEAHAWLDQKLRDSAEGIATRDIPTLAQWLDHCHRNIWRVKPTTAEHDGDVIRVRIVPFLGRFRLDELERAPEKIEQWLRELEKDDYAFYSIRNAFRLVRRALSVAVARDKIRKNPTDTVKLRKPDVVEDDDARSGYAMTPAEAERLLAAIGEDHRLYALYFVALATGMRQAELIGLRWKNVQLTEKNGKAPRIAIREEIRAVEGKPTRLPPKSKHSRRDIWLDEATIAILAAHHVRQHDERMRWRNERPDWNPDDLVFPSEVGTPLGANNLRLHFKKALRRAYGLPKDKSAWTEAHRRIYAIRFHDLRHSAGSLMLLSGAGIADVKEVLGHSSVAITAAIYLHSYEATKRAAVAGAADLLRTRGAS